MKKKKGRKKEEKEEKGRKKKEKKKKPPFLMSYEFLCDGPRNRNLLRVLYAGEMMDLMKQGHERRDIWIL